MNYYLYVKTHITTGLKYLGYTKNDPHKYNGSGKYWLKHIKKHGFHIKTDILLVSNSMDEIKKTGLFFSKLWNVVKSSEWANLTEESGQGISSEQSSRIQKARIARGDVKNLYNKEKAVLHNKKMLEEGRHPSQNRNFIDATNSKMLEMGIHPFQIKRENNQIITKSRQLNKVLDGTHAFKNKVPCYDKQGTRILIDKDLYHKNKLGDPVDWQFAMVNSLEGKRRKEIIL